MDPTASPTCRSSETYLSFHSLLCLFDHKYPRQASKVYPGTTNVPDSKSFQALGVRRPSHPNFKRHLLRTLDQDTLILIFSRYRHESGACHRAHRTSESNRVLTLEWTTDSTMPLQVGGGPSGLVLALSLLRNGVPVRVIEKSWAPRLGQRGAGIMVRRSDYFFSSLTKCGSW